jgi:phosphate transport system substrate-binding protein
MLRHLFQPLRQTLRHRRFTAGLLTCAVAAACAASLLPSSALAGPRDGIRIVGSSTMYRMTSHVAESFGHSHKLPTPVVESTGTGGGFQLFCGGIGDPYPDVATASRLITPAEQAACASHDVEDVQEYAVGTGGLVVANAANGRVFNLTRKHIWLALAETVPVDGKLVANPYKIWSEIDPTLPQLPILIYGPPPTSGPRDALVGMVLEPTCLPDPTIQALPQDQQRQVCFKLREDGAYVEAGEYDDNLLRRVAANPNAVGIIGFHVLTEDPSIKAASVDGILPTVVSIVSGHYPLVRNLYIYVKGDHLSRIPGLADFVRLYTSEQMIGPEGELTDNGLVPLPVHIRKASQEKAATLESPPETR